MPSPWQLRHARRVLRGGGVIAYPTEAVYGLGCDPLDPHAVERLLALKERPVDKGLILVAARFDQLTPFLRPLTADIRQRVEPTWPGPVTWLLPAAPNTPWWLTGAHDSLAVRVTAHPGTAALCKAFGGPLVSTSATLAGHPPARTALTVRRVFGDAVDYILPGELGDAKRPSEIRDAVSGHVLRQG